MSDDETHKTCDEIVELAARLRPLVDAGASEDEMRPLLDKLDAADVRLRQLLSESFARKHGQPPKSSEN